MLASIFAAGIYGAERSGLTNIGPPIHRANLAPARCKARIVQALKQFSADAVL
jgi:hypothetical protein